MATIAATAPEARTAVGSTWLWLRPLGVASVMAVITVWLTCAPVPKHAGAALIHMPVVASASAELVPPHALFDGVIVPPAHPDARPWPRGMVIQPPRTNDRIQAWTPGALDSLLSALLAPWLAIAS